MKTSCPLCSGELLSRGVDADFGLSRCQSCNVRFELSSLARVDGIPGEAPPVPRAPVPMPALAHMEQGPGRLRLRMRLAGPAQRFGLLIVELASGFVVTLAPSIHTLYGPLASGLLVGMGLGLVYLALAGLLNSRFVEMTPGRLSVWVGPVPWPGRIDVRSTQLSQLYCVTQAHPDGYGGESYTYDVLATLDGGARLPLVRKLDTLPQALWLEQEIERFLGIRDEHVPGSSVSAPPPESGRRL